MEVVRLFEQYQAHLGSGQGFGTSVRARAFKVRRSAKPSFVDILAE